MTLEQVLKPDIEELVAQRDFATLRQVLSDWTPQELADLIEALEPPDDVIVFRLLPRDLAADTFEYLATENQLALVSALAQEKERLVNLLNDLSPDDRTSLFEELPGPVTQRLLNMLSPEERRVAVMLLGYPEDSIGRLMTTDYVAIRPEWTVQQALDHIRKHGKDSETLDVVYVVDRSWHLLDDLRVRELLLAEPTALIADLMDERFVALRASDDQEVAVAEFQEHDRVALPVTDSKGVLVGIVTVDDVLDVAQEEATEDIHKLGGSEALDAPYLETPLLSLVGKRARWLVVLFLGEMLTASAMGHFEGEIARAVVLALFVPLIISSGGNSGSQAATLIIRAMAVGEVSLRDWWRVMRREVASGLALGGVLGLIGFIRVSVWQAMFGTYGPHWALIGLTVALSLVGVVMWGTLSGSMLPFVMRRLGVDPATSSTPFVATLVDVTGLVIYFSIAAALLSGTVL